MPRSLIRYYEGDGVREKSNLYIHFSKVRVVTTEPADLSDYFITKEQYRGLLTAVIENERVMEQDIETIKEKLIPRITGMIREWNIQPKNTHRIHITNPHKDNKNNRLTKGSFMA